MPKRPKDLVVAALERHPRTTCDARCHGRLSGNYRLPALARISRAGRCGFALLPHFLGSGPDGEATRPGDGR